ncbi:hypothetical protein FHR32_004034 [Streptosporangium album]|uniref:Uncharacterized protein n=1 Tax=Streptosporangium album TaxID=47479 RepID=A0A7W7RWT5_9ACTN|nr:hypothetical protein [Streptosporangium album]MBB4939729.1 hypothetical protein [Streptosporangium album]
MPLMDVALNAFVIMSGFWESPWLLLIFAAGAAYLGAKAVEVIPFTRRIIERREAERG